MSRLVKTSILNVYLDCFRDWFPQTILSISKQLIQPAMHEYQGEFIENRRELFWN